jgi:ATP-binding cassette subfamily B (MDR/TAP) protein 6
MFSRSRRDTQPLLSGSTTNYGSIPRQGPASAQPPKELGAFADFFSKMRKLLPFIWPKGNTWLQFLVMICFGLLIIGRIVNVLTQIQLKSVVDDLSGEQGQIHFPWKAILFYVFLRFLQGGVGLVQSTQNYLWIPIGQYTTRKISVEMFKHLHDLSLQFHINRKTGEVLRVMVRNIVFND